MVAKAGTNRAAAHLNGGSPKKNKKGDDAESSSKGDDADDSGDDADEEENADEEKNEGEKSGKKTGRKKGSSSSGKPEPRKRKADFLVCVARRVKIKDKDEPELHFVPVDAPKNLANTSEAIRWIKDNGEALANLTVVVMQIRERVRIESVTKVKVRTGVSD